MADQAPRGQRVASVTRMHAVQVALVSGLAVLTVALIYLPSRMDRGVAAGGGSSYTLMQMNLCLSGRASCFSGADYPFGVDEAAARIIDSDADVVTLDEVCRGDVEQLARLTGYQQRFSVVRHDGASLPCVNPGHRGSFGIAILSRRDIVSAVDRPFLVQDDYEERRWMCVTTADDVTVCATHLDVRWSNWTQAVNDAQCREFAGILADYATRGPLIAAGDMNRIDPCLTDGMWIRNDAGASQAAGMQQVYGNGAFARPASGVIPMKYTDHDGLIVTSQLSR